MTDPSERHSRPTLLPGGGISREWVRALTIIAGIFTLYFIAPFGQNDDPLPLATATILTVVVALILAVMITRRIIQVFNGDTSRSLSNLVVLLAFVVVAFAIGYFTLARSDPEQVSGLNTRLDALYFTLTTVGTVGYGDIHPAGQAARAIACLQLVFNAIFVTGLVRTVMYQAQTHRAERNQTKPDQDPPAQAVG